LKCPDGIPEVLIRVEHYQPVPKDRATATRLPRNPDEKFKRYSSPLYRPGQATRVPGR